MKSSTPPSTLTAPRRLIPSVTTIGLASSSWRDKIKEITELRLSEVAPFVTGLNDEERADCFAMLSEAQAYRMFQIPFVHATQGMRESEYLMLMNQFGTQRFNYRARSLREWLGARARESSYCRSKNPRSRLFAHVMII